MKKINNPRVLMVSTSLTTKGGISTVLKTYMKMDFWEKYKCNLLVTHINGNFLIKLFYLFKSIIKLIIILKNYHIIHFHVGHVVSALRKIPFILIALIFNKKIVTQIHASKESTLKKNKFIFKLLLSLTNELIYIYPSFIENSRIRNSKTLIHNPYIFEKPKNVTKKNQFLFVGNVIKAKGVYDLIKAFSVITKNYKSWNLLIAGAGEIKSCKALIKSLKISSNVKLLGWVEPIELKKIMNETKVFCLPSYTEGFPMSILESINYNQLIVTTNSGGIGDFIKNNYNGYVSYASDIKSLQNNLLKSIKDSENNKKMLKNSKSLLLNEFNPKKINNKINFMYKKVYQNE